MKREEMNASQREGLRMVHQTLAVGIGTLATEATLIYLDVTDKVNPPGMLHGVLAVFGLGLVGAASAHIVEIRRTPLSEAEQ